MPLELSSDAQRWLGRLPEIVNLLLVVLIGLAAARLFWQLWPAPDSALVPVVTDRARARAPEVDIDAIASAHLFGVAAAPKKKPEPEKIIDAPETSLNLELTGIISDSSRRRSRALIKDAQNKQDSYAVGAAITRGVKLHAIYANRVILDRNGRFETLTLESLKKARELSGITRQRSVSPELAQDLGAVRQKILANPQTARRYIRLQPARQNGNLIGYRVSPGADRTLFEKAGLQSGEIVTAINGQPLDNPAASLKLLGNLAQAGSASVTLLRDGQQRTVTVNFQ